MARGPGLRVKLSKIEDVAGSRKAFRKPYFFQCPPLDEFSHTHPFAHQRYMTVSKGEFSRRAGRQLITCTIRTLVVEWGPSFVVEADYDIEKLRDRLLDIGDKGYPMRLLVTHQYGTTPELEMAAVIDSVVVTERAEETDARYLEIAFTEWRHAEVTRKRRPGGKQFPITITIRKNGTLDGSGKLASSIIDRMVKKGNGKDPSLRDFARAAYGMPSAARDIAKANSINWGADTPLTQHPRYKNGGKLKLPAITTGKAHQVGAGLGD